jgi:hypothetical protein
MYSVVSAVHVETLMRGFQQLRISDVKYLAGYMQTMSWLVWNHPDRMHIKARMVRVVLVTNTPTGSLAKDNDLVDNRRRLANIKGRGS